MALNDAALVVMANALDGVISHVAIHTAQPNASGSNASSAARVAVNWTVDADGDLTNDALLSFTGGAASGAATHVGFWSASTSGTFYGWLALTGDQTFNAAGEYEIAAGDLDLVGTAS